MNATHDLRSPARALLLSLAAFGASASSAEAQTAPRTDDRLQCASEAERGQRLRSAGKLIDAAAQLAICTRAACPDAVRADCSLWQREIVRATPSILVHARDGAGAEIREVTLAVDEKRVVQSLGDQPISVDPGDHVIEFSRAGAFPVKEAVHLEAGQKNHLVTISFKLAPEGASSVRPDSGSLGVSQPGSNGPNVPAWTAAGFSLVAAGTFVYFGTTGKSELNRLNDACQSSCDQASIDSAWRKLVIADVSLGVALASAGAATYLFLADSGNGDEKPRKPAVARIVPSTRGVTFYWQGQF